MFNQFLKFYVTFEEVALYFSFRALLIIWFEIMFFQTCYLFSPLYDYELRFLIFISVHVNYLRLFFWHLSQQILLAVNTIHEERIVHSDLKPANFLLVKGSLKLIDFGIAKAIMNDTTNIQRDSQVMLISTSFSTFDPLVDIEMQVCLVLLNDVHYWI